MKNLMRLGCLILLIFSVSCKEIGNGFDTQNKPGGVFVDDGGNGKQYDGMVPAGKYVRQLSEPICGPQVKNLGEIIVTGSQRARGRVIDTQTCETTFIDVDLSSVEHSSYQLGRIGYFEGIYTSQGKNDDQKIPGFDEVWCRKEGSTSSIGFDIVVKADYQARKFTAITASSVVEGDGLLRETPLAPHNVERRFEDNERVRYKANGFDLDIRRRDYNSTTGLMLGDLEYSRNGIIETMRINCRLGGELDVMIPKK